MGKNPQWVLNPGSVQFRVQKTATSIRPNQPFLGKAGFSESNGFSVASLWFVMLFFDNVKKMMLLKNDQMQFSEKHGKFRDGEIQKYFMFKMDALNRSYLRIVLGIGPIPIERMDESQAEIFIIFE